jgi:hypothetical protein
MQETGASGSFVAAAFVAGHEQTIDKADNFL